jgi:hypothetical protein
MIFPDAFVYTPDFQMFQLKRAFLILQAFWGITEDFVMTKVELLVLFDAISIARATICEGLAN